MVTNHNESSTDPLVDIPIHQTEFGVEEAEAQRVCVYVDRAEVTRKIVLPVPAKGKHSILVRGVTESADTNSIRVKGGHGSNVDCTIQEVSFERNYIKPDTSAHEAKVKSAEEAFNVAEKHFKSLMNKRESINSQRSLVTGYVKGMLTPTAREGQGPAIKSEPAVGNDIVAVEQLLEFQAKKDRDHADKLLDLESEIKIAEKDREAAKNNLRIVTGSSGIRKVSRDVSILLSTDGSEEESAKIVLELSYMVNSASWAPTYDLRVSISPPSLALSYQGVVTQSTGEDWKSVRLSLSTAAPATGGTPPAPPTQIVQWKRNLYQQQNIMKKSRNIGGGGFSDRQMISQIQQSNMAFPTRRQSISADELSIDASELNSESDCDDDDREAGVAVAGVKSEGTGSATFTIEHPSTIESDSKEHKVTVMIAELDPEFRHFATPALGEAAYLQARVRNTSACPFLQSDRASIFLSGAFVTQTTIKATNPGEVFSIFLGVDSQVKISHKLIKKSTSKGNEGSMFKSKKDSSVHYEYRTLIHNTKQDQPVRIQVVQLFPRSSDSKINVELIKPPRSSVPIAGENKEGDEKKKKQKLVPGEFDVTQNKVTNNLVFAGEIAAGQKSEIPYCYEVQWPDVDADIEIV